jgi:hypothetical protein
VTVDAGVTPLRGILELTRAVLGALNLDPILDGLAAKVVARLGYEAHEIPHGITFLTWVIEERGWARERSLVATREAVEGLLKPLDIDPDLRLAVGYLLDRHLGIETGDVDVLTAWIRGDRVARRAMTGLGLARSLSKFNARTMLEGWGTLIIMAGLPGMLVTIDGLEQLLAPKDPEGRRPYYTRSRRDETYEMLREFIDNGESLSGIFLVFAAGPELLTDPRRGVESYPALNARITNEVTTRELNRFEDLSTGTAYCARILSS